MQNIDRDTLIEIFKKAGLPEDGIGDAETLSQNKNIPLAQAAVNLELISEDVLQKYLPDEPDAAAGEAKKDADDDYVGEEVDSDTEIDFSDENSEAPIIKIVDLIMKDAYTKRASDIHIEPFENRIRVRYRVDGHLMEALTLPKKHQDALLARFKIISNLDITESRVPQDGRFKMRIGDKEVDYRVSILPVYWGGKVVMRALDKSNLRVNLNEIGFTQQALTNFSAALKRPFGMIIVTGPTGSGKSTTLYSVLSELNSIERNIITVEDPIEYQVGGITQVPVRAEINMTFSSALKAILRQSPDVVMIGEIRDSETADIAVKAALTGQIVLSTLHTNDAAGAVVRMKDMGVERFLISSSLTLVAAQRLCRKICDHCKVPVNYKEEELITFGFDSTVAQHIKEPNFSKGKGCSRCGRSGYNGRTAITETLLVTDEMRTMIEENCTAGELKQYAMKSGMLTLRTDALLKAAQGITTVEEVMRVTSADT